MPCWHGARTWDWSMSWRTAKYAPEGSLVAISAASRTDRAGAVFTITFPVPIDVGRLP